MKNEKLTELDILNAARSVFMEKGMTGARMQEIADRAGINKAMLHYYFRSKEKLFDKVFEEAFKDFWPKVEGAIMSSGTPSDIFASIIDAYIKMFTAEPYLPNFVLSEIHRSPQYLEGLMERTGLNPKKMIHFIQTLMDNGLVKRMDPFELLINIFSLCIFPFAAKPLLTRLLWNNKSEEFDAFVMHRKASVMEIIEKCYLI